MFRQRLVELLRLLPLLCLLWKSFTVRIYLRLEKHICWLNPSTYTQGPRPPLRGRNIPWQPSGLRLGFHILVILVDDPSQLFSGHINNIINDTALFVVNVFCGLITVLKKENRYKGSSFQTIALFPMAIDRVTLVITAPVMSSSDGLQAPGQDVTGSVVIVLIIAHECVSLT